MQKLYRVFLIVSSEKDKDEVTNQIENILEEAISEGADFNFSISCQEIQQHPYQE